MSFSGWTFLFQIINFVVLVYILNRLLYKPLHEAIDRRRQENARVQAEAEAARKEAASLQEQLHQRLEAIDRERQDQFRKAREQAEAERANILSDADRTAARRRNEAEQELERFRAEARQALRNEMVHSAVELARRILREASGASLHEQLVHRLIETLQRIPDPEREHLRDEWRTEGGALLETAEPFNGPLLEQLKAAVAELAAGSVDLTVQPQPSLLSGVRLRLGGHVWDSSLASPLDSALANGTGNGNPRS